MKTIKQFKDYLIKNKKIKFELMRVIYSIKLVEEKVEVVSSYSKKINTFNSIDEFISEYQIYGSNIKDILQDINV